jgi:hypothetical protein
MTVEKYSFGTALVELATGLRREAEYVKQALARMEPAQYDAVGTLHQDLAGHEAAFDAILTRIRGDGLDPSVSLDRLTSAYTHLQRASQTHVRAIWPQPSVSLCVAAAESLSHGYSLVAVNLTRLYQVYERNLSSDSSFGPILARIKNQIGRAESSMPQCRKILRTLPQPGSDNEISLSEEIRASLMKTAAQIRDLGYALGHTAAAAQQHIHGSVTLRTLDAPTAVQLALGCRIDLSEDGEALVNVSSDDVDASLLPLHLKTVMKTSSDMVGDFAQKLAAGEFDTDKVDAPAVYVDMGARSSFALVTFFFIFLLLLFLMGVFSSCSALLMPCCIKTSCTPQD